jgi:endogenous inhibitor of DNA gyrase (YacG/DUF329 family)
MCEKKKLKVECSSCGAIVEYEKDSTGRWVGTVIGAAGGGAIGGAIGSSLGIALLGTAISGLWPVAIIGAILIGGVGRTIGKLSEKVKCPKCGAKLKLE